MSVAIGSTARAARLTIIFLFVIAPPLVSSAEAKSRDRQSWSDRLENRRDARRAGIVAGVVTAQVVGAAGKGRADREFRECQEDERAIQYQNQIDSYGAGYYSGHDARSAGYDCQVQHYEARAESRRAARRTAVAAGIVTREIVRD